MKSSVFVLILFLSSIYSIFSYPLSFGGGLSYQFTNYSNYLKSDEIGTNFKRVDNGINLNLYFDMNYAIFDISYKNAFNSLNINNTYLSFGLYGIYPISFIEHIRILFPLLGFKYTIDFSSVKQNLFFITLGFAGDIFIQEIKGLYIRPLIMLSISPFTLKNYSSSLITEITIGVNIGWKFFDWKLSYF